MINSSKPKTIPSFFLIRLGIINPLLSAVGLQIRLNWWSKIRLNGDLRGRIHDTSYQHLRFLVFFSSACLLSCLKLQI